jgi:hypothetical protein
VGMIPKLYYFRIFPIIARFQPAYTTVAPQLFSFSLQFTRALFHFTWLALPSARAKCGLFLWMAMDSSGCVYFG